MSGGEGTPRVAVVGGGVSGLAAAIRLLDRAAAAGRPVAVTVFEPGRLGGGCRTLTEEHGGERIVRELGPDSFLSKPPHLVRLCERVGRAGELIGTNPAPRGALVWAGRRAERVPAGFTLLAPSAWGPTLRSPVLSPLHKLRLLTEPLRRRGTAADESIGAFVRRRLGRGVLDRLAAPLAAGIYAGDVEKLSLHACLPQFAADEAARGRVTGRKPLADRASENEAGARYSLFVTPRGGVGRVAEAAAECVRQAGGTLQGDAVVALARDGGGWRVRTDGGAERFDAVVLAVPARVAGPLLGEVAPPLAAELGGVEFSTSVIVNTLHRREDVTGRVDAFGLVIPERWRTPGLGGAGGPLSAFAVSFASHKFPGRAPAGWVQLRTFLGGVNRPGCADATDDELVAAARDELAKYAGVRWAGDTTATARVGRWMNAMPQYHVGHLARVERVERLVADLPGLELAGNGLHGVGLPAAVKSGEHAAGRVWACLTSEASAGALAPRAPRTAPTGG